MIFLIIFFGLDAGAQTHGTHLLTEDERYSIGEADGGARASVPAAAVSEVYSGFSLQVGYLGLPGVGPDRFEGGVTIGSSTHGRDVIYGLGALRLQLGNAMGVAFSNIAGYNLTALGGDSLFPLIVGIEPLNVEFSAVSSIDGDLPRNYITWSPSVALGAQIHFTDECRVAVVARGGGYGSTLNTEIGAAYGLGGYINCNDAVDFAAHIQRLHSESHPVDIITTEVQLPVISLEGSLHMSVGIRAEYLNVHEGGANILIELPRNDERPEWRSFLLVTFRQRL